MQEFEIELSLKRNFAKKVCTCFEKSPCQVRSPVA